MIQRKSTRSKKAQNQSKKAQGKTELERQQEGRQKTGVFTGYTATNRLNGSELPIRGSALLFEAFEDGGQTLGGFAWWRIE